MPKRFEFRKGFMRFQRLGPIKFGEQSRWSVRAPEGNGLWAFPYPHYDAFFAYHRYMDILPKELKGGRSTDPKWWRRDRAPGEEPYGGSYEIPSEYDRGDYPVARMEEIHWAGDGRDRHPTNGYVISEFYKAQDEWVETVGKRVLPLREFWYSGELYSHFTPAGDVGNYTVSALEEGNEWSVLTTERLAQILKKPGSVIAMDSHDGSGKPRSYQFATDHLEVFIPRGRGVIRHRL